MKKIISVFLLLSLLLSLCACGKNDSSITTPTDTTPPTESEVIETTPPSNTLDVEESSYYKNNKWNQGIWFTDVVGEQCAEAGDEWPALETGDLFVDKLFMYGYNMRFDGEKWIKDETMNGWGARALSAEVPQKAISYDVCQTINQAPTVSAAYLLSGTTLSTYAKSMYIPETVTDITGLLCDAKLSTNITVRIFGIPTQYDSAFDVVPDIKKKVDEDVVYMCSKTISLYIAQDAELVMTITGETKLGNIKPLILSPSDEPEPNKNAQQ